MYCDINLLFNSLCLHQSTSHSLKGLFKSGEWRPSVFSLNVRRTWLNKKWPRNRNKSTSQLLIDHGKPAISCLATWGQHKQVVSLFSCINSSHIHGAMTSFTWSPEVRQSLSFGSVSNLYQLLRGNWARKPLWSRASCWVCLFVGLCFAGGTVGLRAGLTYPSNEL